MSKFFSIALMLAISKIALAEFVVPVEYWIGVEAIEVPGDGSESSRETEERAGPMLTEHLSTEAVIRAYDHCYDNSLDPSGDFFVEASILDQGYDIARAHSIIPIIQVGFRTPPLKRINPLIDYEVRARCEFTFSDEHEAVHHLLSQLNLADEDEYYDGATRWQLAIEGLTNLPVESLSVLFEAIHQHKDRYQILSTIKRKLSIEEKIYVFNYLAGASSEVSHMAQWLIINFFNSDFTPYPPQLIENLRDNKHLFDDEFKNDLQRILSRFP